MVECDLTESVTLFAANRDDIDVDLIPQEWSPFATTEATRTA